jgi:hypothetical protein
MWRTERVTTASFLDYSITYLEIEAKCMSNILGTRLVNKNLVHMGEPEY